MHIKTIYILIAVFLLNSCSVKYSFTGASISPNVNTVDIKYFNNRASIVNPQLSQIFTEALKDRITNQTRLTSANSGADLIFEGDITDYRTEPTAIQGNETVASNRFTIVVKVKFTNNKNNKEDFEQSFSRYKDYAASKSFQEVEASLSTEIIEELTEDIFNKALTNW